MTIYTLLVDPEQFVTLKLVDGDFDSLLDGFNGCSMTDRWPPPRVRLTPSEVVDGRIVGGFPNLVATSPTRCARSSSRPCVGAPP
jgi:hypothetical protein